MHIYIFFFQQVRQIKSQTFNRCIVDIRAHSVISLLCYNLQQSVKNKRGIFWYVSFYHGSLHNVTEVSDTNKILLPPAKKEEKK